MQKKNVRGAITCSVGLMYINFVDYL
uniref:Uncharacterized protein n=1 Tax=Arundo donax TaxID=35708 RepID=A0A0A8YBL4_ARUDO